jgi:hypothetical protein
MNKKMKDAIEMIKDELIDGIRSTGKVLEEVAKTVSHLTAEMFKSAGTVGVSAIEFTSDIARTVIQAVLDTGGDLTLAARGIVLGVLRGTQDLGGQTFDLIAETAANIVKNTAELTGDVASAAKGAVHGAIEGAREIGVNVEEAASSAATGAVKAAYEFGSEVGTKARNAVTGTISGIKVVLKEPFKSDRTKDSGL